MDYLAVILSTIAVIFGGKAFLDWRKNRTPRLDLEEVEETRAQYLQENFEKAMTDFNYLEEAKKSVNDRELSAYLNDMQKTAKNLLANLERNPDRIPVASKFIDYYQDRAVKIVKQYKDLEETQLSTDKVRELKGRMKSILASLNAAYLEQFENVLNDKFISAEAELKVMEQHLDEEGIRRETIDIGQLDDNGNVRIETDLLNQPIEDEDTSNLKNMIAPQQKRRHSGQSTEIQRRRNFRDKPAPFPEEERPEIIRHKLIQSALALFLGSFGAHKFYQGKSFQGVLYLLFCWSFFPGFIGFIEGIRYLFMPVDDFYEQYIKKE